MRKSTIICLILIVITCILSFILVSQSVQIRHYYLPGSPDIVVYTALTLYILLIVFVIMIVTELKIAKWLKPVLMLVFVALFFISLNAYGKSRRKGEIIKYLSENEDKIKKSILKEMGKYGAYPDGHHISYVYLYTFMGYGYGIAYADDENQQDPGQMIFRESKYSEHLISWEKLEGHWFYFASFD